MTASVFKLTTAATNNLTKVKDLPASLKGYAVTNTAAYAIFLKFFWYQPTASAPVPTVGTTVPDLTIQIGATAYDKQSWPDGMQKGGLLYLAVTKNAADSDNTAVASGDGLVTVLYE